MTKTMLGALGAVLLLSAGVAVATAQKPNRTPDPVRTEARRELMTKLKAFAKSDILPDLGRWKTQLDNSMTPADLAKLNGLRARSASLKKQMMEKGLGMAKAWKGEDYETLKKNREAMKALKEEHKAIMTELKPLAVTYAGTLMTIGQEAKPKVEVWKERAKAIVQEWAASHDKEAKGGMHGFGGGFGHFFGMGGKGDRMQKVVAHFMLWDGTDVTEDVQKMMDSPETGGGFDLK